MFVKHREIIPCIAFLAGYIEHRQSSMKIFGTITKGISYDEFSPPLDLSATATLTLKATPSSLRGGESR
jgi:hypothetical protein